MEFAAAMTRPEYAALVSARYAYDTELVAAFGDAAERVRYTGIAMTMPGSALKAAYEAVNAADRAFYALFKVAA